MFTMTVIGVHSQIAGDGGGYGRDGEEALAHAGWTLPPNDAEYLEVRILDSADDALSAKVAESVCDYHMNEDDEVPESVKQRLRAMIKQGDFASAVRYCMEAVWDRGFEQDLPPSERKYT